MAYINHASNGGASVFVDGELVATVGEAAAAHLPMICGGVRLEAKELAPALQVSEVSELIERLIKRDVLWIEM